ncbi:MAG: deoxynucleoside kinase [Nanoarchaeota archaeon]|nr:deoxynucleoside kinase [Nanoarchaeota archaeon]
MSEAVVFEGLPGCGKTSLINLLASELNVTKIPEILDQGKLWGEAKETENQDFFWLNDVSKMRLAKNSTEVALVDRGYASTLAYNYARTAIDKTNDYQRMLDKYYEDIVENNLTADLYIYVDTPIESAFVRKDRKVEKGNPWRDPTYLKGIITFYEMFFTEMERCTPTIRLGRTLSLEQLVKELEHKIVRLLNYDQK